MTKSNKHQGEISEIVAEMHLSSHKKIFNHFAESASLWASSPIAFVLALFFVVGWLIVGTLFNFSHTWELILGSVPTLVTFLLVFLIQSSQSRETLAVQLKLNELIRATKGAHTIMLSLEKLTGEELSILCTHYEDIAHEARKRMKRGEPDQGAPELGIIQHPDDRVDFMADNKEKENDVPRT